jgi:hypothetical protein
MIRRTATKLLVKKATPPIRTETKKSAQKQREVQMTRADCDKKFQSEWDIFCSDSFQKRA